MKIAVVNDEGRVLQIIELSAQQATYTPSAGTYAIGCAPPDMDYYWDGSKFLPMGAAPSMHHHFDYTSRSWIDLRTLDEIKTQKWAEIKLQRDQVEFGGFEFEGGVYDSDRVAQTRISGAVLSGAGQIWTLADNTTRTLTADQLQLLYQALQAHVSTVHERGRIARQLICSAETREQVESVEF